MEKNNITTRTSRSYHSSLVTRTWSLLLALIVVVGILPTNVLAASKTVSAAAVENFVHTAESKEGSGRFSGLKGTGSWCGYFVGWALDNSTVSTETSKNYGANCGPCCNAMILLAQQGFGTIYIVSNGNKTSAYTQTYYNKFVNRGAPKSAIQTVASFAPQRGDIVLYDWLWDVRGDFDHVGIMTSSNSTIEGNTSGGKVAKRSFKDAVPSGWSGTRGDYVCAYFRFNTTGASATTPKTVTAKTGSYYTIKNVGTGKYLNVYGSRSSNNTNITIYAKDGTSGQDFKFTYNSKFGGYTITPRCATSRRVNVYGYSAANGSNVCTWSTTNSATQTWIIKEVSGGYIICCADNPNYVLTATGSANSSNVNIQRYVPGNSYQLWSSCAFSR